MATCFHYPCSCKTKTVLGKNVEDDFSGNSPANWSYQLKDDIRMITLTTIEQRRAERVGLYELT